MDFLKNKNTPTEPDKTPVLVELGKNFTHAELLAMVKALKIPGVKSLLLSHLKNFIH